MTPDPKIQRTVNVTTTYTNIVPWDVYLVITRTIDNLVEVEPGRWYRIVKRSTWEIKP